MSRVLPSLILPALFLIGIAYLGHASAAEPTASPDVPEAKSDFALQQAKSSTSASTLRGRRLAYLDSTDPYYVGLTFPRLTTPQWLGEEGVEAVVVLAIDDMRDTQKYETFLRPILDRLKQIDGRAPVSIMTNSVDPTDTQLQRWLKEGLNIDVHTIDHPCPLLAGGDFEKARSTCDRCIDLLTQIPNNEPVAFRMPCCDSLNTLSPRFFAEIFNQPTPAGNYLQIDSSVFNILTADDPELPRSTVSLDDGTSRFRRYLPFKAFVNTIENYPYPFVINRLCWEFPTAVPSDWEAQNIQQPNNPRTVEDWKAVLDAVVLKQGVFNLVFHPHNWIRNDQVVQVIDYAQQAYGNKVKFLNFREAAERLNTHLLSNQPLRAPDGSDNGVRLIDLNDDGYLDVVIANEKLQQTKIWDPEASRWNTTEFPLPLVTRNADGEAVDAQPRFGIVGAKHDPVLLVRNDQTTGAWRFADGQWVADDTLLAGLELDGDPILTGSAGRDLGVRLDDINADGCCELLVGNATQQAVFVWDEAKATWSQAPYSLPGQATFVDGHGHDRGLRLVDVNDDLQPDVLFSNEAHNSLHLYADNKTGWSREVLEATRRDEDRIPMIARSGTNNGAWFHNRELWVQNEDTDRLAGLVDRRSFNDLLQGVTPEPKSPAASLAAMQVRDGLKIELVASEPLTVDPIAIDWGPDGKLWVVEMADYPLGVDGKPGGRVRFLEDTDGDGRYDQSTLLLDGLQYPTSVMAWRDGVLVTAAPDIIYAADTTGDGKADVREVLYTDFAKGNPQHLVNGLQRGLDNWVYGANGHSGGTPRSLKTGAEVQLRSHDFRIRPDTGEIDLRTGVTQFIRSRDDWGNWFGSDNINPMWHFVMPEHYLGRNPHVASPDSRVHVSETPGSSPVFARSRTLARFNDFHTADSFTSACSAIIYRDNFLGEEFVGNSFVCEPVHNLVHCEVVRPKGLAFTSRRHASEQASEFLASTDNFFRPTTVQTGPDGALWVVDMYRFVIEHPEWIPIKFRLSVDLRAGSDRGRIYRIYPVDKTPRAAPKLSEANISEFVETLDSPNGPQRDMAQQLLVGKNDTSSVSLLEEMVTAGSTPQGRLQALCTLDGMQQLRAEVVANAIHDKHPGVRRHAARLAERFAAESTVVADALLAAVADEDPKVALQLAFSLGEWNDPRAGSALGKLAASWADEPLMLAAIVSSSQCGLQQLVAEVVSESQHQAPPSQFVADLLTTATAEENSVAVSQLLGVVATPNDEGTFALWQLESFGGLLDTLSRRGTTLEALLDKQTEASDALTEKLTRLIEFARVTATAHDAALENRLAAVRLVGQSAGSGSKSFELLSTLLGPTQPRALQAAAIEALGKSADDRVATYLLGAWQTFSPALRADVLEMLFSRDAWVMETLTAVEEGIVLPAELDALRRQRLLNHRDSAIQERAESIFAGAMEASRQEVLENYAEVTQLTGDPVAGAELFAKKCAVCHKFDNKGHAVGPDLAALTDKSPQAMLVAILDPNRAIEAQYLSYSAITEAGLTYAGILATESANSLTLLGQEGKSQVLLRDEIDELVSTGKSLMPEGLEKDLSPQQLANVVAYLGSTGPKPKRFAGNHPQLVEADDLRREYFCLSTNCEIFGSSLIFEPENQNLGYWFDSDDRAVWTLDVKRAGRYAVLLDWACPAEKAGNTFVIEAAGQKLLGKVEATGGWNDYTRSSVGTIKLAEGKQRVAIRCNGTPEGALFDLKSITLRPAGR